MVGLALLLGPPTAPAAPMVGLALAKNYGAFFRFLVVYLGHEIASLRRSKILKSKYEFLKYEYWRSKDK